MAPTTTVMKSLVFVVVFLAAGVHPFYRDKSQSDVCGLRFLVGPPSGSRIMGGQESAEGAWPWMVHIQLANSHFCGGSIVGPQWVLSASHCFVKYQKAIKYIRLVAGLNVLSQPGAHAQFRSIKKIYFHPNFNHKTLDNDVTLVLLDSPYDFNEHVQPICTNGSEEMDHTGTRCFISGWGSTSLGGSSENKLLEAEVGLIDRQTCTQPTWYWNLITVNMICAGLEAGGVDSCQGDSGGPLQCYSDDSERFYQVGVTSFGIDCGAPLKPGVYARVSRFSEWIEETMLRGSGGPKACSNLVMVLSVGLSGVLMLLDRRQ